MVRMWRDEDEDGREGWRRILKRGAQCGGGGGERGFAVSLPRAPPPLKWSSQLSLPPFERLVLLAAWRAFSYARACVCNCASRR